MYPRVIISKEKLISNIQYLSDKCKNDDISLMGVTKVYSGYMPILELFMESKIDYIGDSRIKNLKKLTDCKIPKVLIRLPMISDIRDVVDYVDISFNSELATVSELNDYARYKGVYHRIVLMVDLGDLREGMLPKEVEGFVRAVMNMKHIIIVGVAVNLTCYGGVIPSVENLGQLVDIKNLVEGMINRKMEIVSGGNSSSLFLLEDNAVPEGINNLRLGESIAVGRETAFGKKIEGVYDDVFKLQAEIIEIREKESIPKGELGMDAFGNKPEFVDRGVRRRAILAVGKQDVYHEDLIPYDEAIIILGSSSDHLIVDVSDSNKDYKLGDVIEFKLTYGSLLSLMTSEFVYKKMI